MINASIMAAAIIMIVTNFINESDAVHYPALENKDKIVYQLEQRQYDETEYDEKLVERALLYIENYPENSAEEPDIENTLYREWRKKTAIIDIQSTDENRINTVINDYLSQQGINETIPKSITYYNSHPFIKYYEDEKSGKFAFVASIPDCDNLFTSLYCGVAYIEDLKQEGSLSYDFNQEDKLLSETCYNNKSGQVTEIVYKYKKEIPFPIITRYNNSRGEEGGFYSLPYMNTGQRFWIDDSLMEFDENGRWTKYNGDIYGNIFGDNNEAFQYESEIERYNTPVYSENGELEKIVETLRSSRYQDNPNEWIEDGRIELKYSETGSLAQIDYSGFSGNHGSSGNTGTIYYDKNARVVHFDMFHSSGDYHYFYMYQGNEKYPFAIFEFGGIAYSSDTFDDCYMLFGMDFDAWLLKNDEELENDVEI